MPVVDTSTLTPDSKGHDSHQVYNGLDACVTVEVWRDLCSKMDERSQIIYNFERGMQAPALDMMRRGVLIDPYEKRSGIEKITESREKVLAIWDRYCIATVGRPLKITSTKDLSWLFYEAMRLPVQHERRPNGERSPSVGRKALEKLQLYLYARPFIECIFAAREEKKLLEVLQNKVDDDGRMRTSYNVAGTETGRWSSSKNVTGGGGNFQNITAQLRRMFISDYGKKMCGIDLEQAESRVVGLIVFWLFGDTKYLDACEAGDLHTFVTRIIWPNLPWTGNEKDDKEIAERQFYRMFTYRDMAKRGGHGTNYYGTAFTMAQNLKVPKGMMDAFQEQYLGEGGFPGIRKWHRWTAEQLQTLQYIDTPFGDRRYFFSRPGDDSTLREAIAHVPQSVVGRLLNLILWRLWRYLPEVELLFQVHDAVYFQYNDNPEVEQKVVSKALELFAVPITLNGRTMIIPGEAKVGWNWANEKDKRIKNWVNPNGLRKWNADKPDDRKRLIGLDRPIS